MIPNYLTERLFFALYPSENVRDQLAQLSQQITPTIAGRFEQIQNLHITLAFIGDVGLTVKQCLTQAASIVKNPSFTLTLDKLGYWHKPRILWLAPSEMPTALLTLVTDLMTNLKNCDYQPETRPYQAHITLMRHVNQLPILPIIQPITWSIQDFCLMRSYKEHKNTHYEVLEKWRLSV